MRTLLQQRSTAQSHVKLLSDELATVQGQLDRARRDSAQQQTAAQSIQQVFTSQHLPASQLDAQLVQSGRQATWKPSADRDAASSNPELARLLHQIAIDGEVAVAISNRNLAADNYMLHQWYVSLT